MRKTSEVLGLSALRLAQHQIAASCSIVQSTVHKYLKLAETAHITWPLPETLNDQKLDEPLIRRPVFSRYSPHCHRVNIRQRPWSWIQLHCQP